MNPFHPVVGVSIAALVAVSLPAMAGTVTITGANLSALTFSAPIAGTSAGTTGTGASTQIQLYSSDAVTAGSTVTAATLLPVLQDTAAAFVYNGTKIGGQTVSFGTFANVIAQGAAGNISFNVTSESGVNDAYWQVLLQDPFIPSDTVLINSWGLSQTGSNPFNQGANNNQAYAAAETINGTTVYDGAALVQFNIPPATSALWPNGYSSALWTQVETMSLAATTLASWTVVAMGVATGAFGNNVASTVVVNSVTVPTAVPEPSALATLAVGLSGLGLLVRRKKQTMDGTTDGIC